MASIAIEPHGIGYDKLQPVQTTFTFFIESGSINVIAKDSIKYATITGSKVTDEYFEYESW